jgi:hypothetical protein
MDTKLRTRAPGVLACAWLSTPACQTQQKSRPVSLHSRPRTTSIQNQQQFERDLADPIDVGPVIVHATNLFKAITGNGAV